ncbi:MAG: response regulator [Candidatus Manganitrophaceae bacterium]|nr:MAG: response regulator [Candidatus Manganitrophaceae bacterium]
MAEETKYCLCCGENVPWNRIVRDGNEELTCIYCGFILGATPLPAKTAKCIITVDDVAFVNDLLKGMLINKGLADTVMTAGNGQEFIALFNARLTAKQPVDMVILDLEMPVMDGISAARMMRALEGKYQVAKSPILFFSARKSDETLKKQLGVFSPASYVNKGTSSGMDGLVERVDQLVTHLLNKQRATA